MLSVSIQANIPKLTLNYPIKLIYHYKFLKQKTNTKNSILKFSFKLFKAKHVQAQHELLCK